MRVHTKTVYQTTDKIGEYILVEEEGYEYEGPVARCDPATIVAAIGLAVTLAGTGYEIANQPGKPKIQTSPTPLTTAQNASTTAAVGQQLPSLQALTGGSVSPEYASQFGATQSGNANNPQATGDIQAAINQYFGLNAPGSTGLTGPGGGGPTGNSGGGILDLLSKAKPPAGGGDTGGSGDFVNSLLNSENFKGLVGA